MDQVKVKRWELRYDDEWIGIKEDPNGHHVLYDDMIKEIERQIELIRKEYEDQIAEIRFYSSLNE